MYKLSFVTSLETETREMQACLHGRHGARMTVVDAEGVESSEYTGGTWV